MVWPKYNMVKPGPTIRKTLCSFGETYINKNTTSQKGSDTNQGWGVSIMKGSKQWAKKTHHGRANAAAEK